MYHRYLFLIVQKKNLVSINVTSTLISSILIKNFSSFIVPFSIFRYIKLWINSSDEARSNLRYAMTAMLRHLIASLQTNYLITSFGLEGMGAPRCIVSYHGKKSHYSNFYRLSHVSARFKVIWILSLQIHNSIHFNNQNFLSL